MAEDSRKRDTGTSRTGRLLGTQPQAPVRFAGGTLMCQALFLLPADDQILNS